MLTLRKRSWHARLFLRAYAGDREWLDHPVTGGEWREKSTEKAAMVRARLENGFMSICPYFWKTLYALVVYCFVAVPLYATRNFLRTNWRLVIAFHAGAGAFVLIAGAWWVRGDIAALPSKIVERWYARQTDIAIAEAQRAREEREALQSRNFLADFYRRHPETLAMQKIRDAQWDKELEAKRAKKRAEEWAEFKADLAKAAPWLIVISLAVTLLFTFTPLLNLLLAAFVLLVMIPLERTRLGRMLLEAFAAFFWWYVNLPGRIWRAMKTFIRDTWQFLRGYVMAIKERVCPFITFVDGHPAN